MRKMLFLAGVVCLVLTGCLHGRGVHTVPIERDYAQLEKVCIDEAACQVAKMHRMGLHQLSPYEAESAQNFLEWAYIERAESDRKATWDFAGLAMRYSKLAMDSGQGLEDKGVVPIPDSLEATRAEFERLRARYLELDPCKAKLVAPVVYAHIEANLAKAEEEIRERCHHTEGFRSLRLVEPDIDAIWASDVDGDGIVDMKDGEPWIAEDKDAWQDEDGIPEPKPYPVLEDVLFCDDCDKLSKEAQAYLRGIADMLYDGYSEVTVVLSGHTSSTASNDYNMALSQRRVEAVKAFLLANGVKQDITAIVTSQHGEEQLKVSPDKTSADQALNRRVEIMLDSPDPVSPYCQ